MRTIAPKKFRRQLTVEGFVCDRKGAHEIWKHGDGRMISIPIKHSKSQAITGPVIKRALGIVR